MPQTKRVAIIMSTLLMTASGWISRGQQLLCASSPRKRQAIVLSGSLFSSSSPTDTGESAAAAAAAAPSTALIFDTETTGMVRFREPYTDPSQPDLVQLGFLLVDTCSWKIRNQGSFLVQLRNSTTTIEEGARRVHGITEADCSSFGIEHETALDLFEDLCGKADFVVGHNIKFDALVMQTAFYRRNNSSSNSNSSNNNNKSLFSSKKQICTMMESIQLCKLPSKHPKSNYGDNSTSYKWPSLQEAYRFVTGGSAHYDNDNGDENNDNDGERAAADGESLIVGAHDALVDSQACLKIFRYLVENGHVSLEKPPADEEFLLSSCKADEPDTEGSDADDGDNSSAIVPDIQHFVEEEGASHVCDVGKRNGGIDRSLELEEAAAAAAATTDSDGYSTPERNRNVVEDRSRDVEEAATAGSSSVSESSNNIPEEPTGNTPRLFDPAAFSPDMIASNDASYGGSNSYSNDGNYNNDTSGEAFHVSGNTYKHKEMIKQLGGRWNSVSKVWVFRDTQYLSKLESYDDLTITLSKK